MRLFFAIHTHTILQRALLPKLFMRATFAYPFLLQRTPQFTLMLGEWNLIFQMFMLAMNGSDGIRSHALLCMCGLYGFFPFPATYWECIGFILQSLSLLVCVCVCDRERVGERASEWAAHIREKFLYCYTIHTGTNAHAQQKRKKKKNQIMWNIIFTSSDSIAIVCLCVWGSRFAFCLCFRFTHLILSVFAFDSLVLLSNAECSIRAKR